MANPTLDSEKELLKKEQRRQYMVRWRKANPEKTAAISAKWYKANSEKAKAKAMLWYKANPEKAKLKMALWQKANSEKAKAKAKIWLKANPEKRKVCAKKYYIKCYATPEGRLNHNMRTQLRRCLLKTKETTSQLKHGLPYTIAELRAHLERQFTNGMSWDNRGEWHIDHIIPLSSFKFTSSADPEFQAAWALSNLRPLWAKENQVKYKKRLTLL